MLASVEAWRQVAAVVVFIICSVAMAIALVRQRRSRFAGWEEQELFIIGTGSAILFAIAGPLLTPPFFWPFLLVFVLLVGRNALGARRRRDTRRNK
jgi:hypothetical protein